MIFRFHQNHQKTVMIASIICIVIYISAKFVYAEVRGEVPLLGLENLFISILFLAPLLAVLAWYDIRQRRKQKSLSQEYTNRTHNIKQKIGTRIILACLIIIAIAIYFLAGIFDSEASSERITNSPSFSEIPHQSESIIEDIQELQKLSEKVVSECNPSTEELSTLEIQRCIVATDAACQHALEVLSNANAEDGIRRESTINVEELSIGAASMCRAASDGKQLLEET